MGRRAARQCPGGGGAPWGVARALAHRYRGGQRATLQEREQGQSQLARGRPSPSRLLAERLVDDGRQGRRNGGVDVPSGRWGAVVIWCTSAGRLALQNGGCPVSAS